MGQNRPFDGAGDSLRDRRDQGIGAEGVPREVRGNVVLPQGRSRDASSGLLPEVGGGRDRGRNQHEVSGPDPRQPLDLRRSLRAPGTVCRSDGERLRMVAASAGRARRRSAPAVRRRGAIEAPLRSSDLGGGPDGQPLQSPKGQEAAQDGGHQGSEGLPHHFGGSSVGARRVSPVRTAGTEVSRDLPPHSGFVGPGRSGGRRR